MCDGNPERSPTSGFVAAEATEESHHGKPSFRVRKKIFATVPESGYLNVMLGVDDTEFAVSADPAAYEKLHWGKQLAGVRLKLRAADRHFVQTLLREAWKLKAPKKLLSLLIDPEHSP